MINDKKYPFKTFDWSNVPTTQHQGDSGTAYWQTIQLHGLRIRKVEYSQGYIADHWCKKGHIVHCLEGSVTSELASGETFVLTHGCTYVVSDDMSSHRSHSSEGVKLLIIDGDFLG